MECVALLLTPVVGTLIIHFLVCDLSLYLLDFGSTLAIVGIHFFDHDFCVQICTRLVFENEFEEKSRSLLQFCGLLHSSQELDDLLFCFEFKRKGPCAMPEKFHVDASISPQFVAQVLKK